METIRATKKQASKIRTWLNALSSLFYPNLCLACSKNLPPGGNFLCVSCTYKLPKTDFHLHQENPLTERFWGRVDLKAGTACYHFSKSGRTQQLLHRLKYEGKRVVGVEIGKLHGSMLREAPLFQGIDMIVPVPLHPRKQRLRGYNQSAMYAMGLSERMGVPWQEALQRTSYTDSQTRKSRMERFANVESVFAVRNEAVLRGKHVLLVDDVVTTGATLEACAQCLLKVPEVKVSIAAIAIAN
jgi:ComF family protein